MLEFHADVEWASAINLSFVTVAYFKVELHVRLCCVTICNRLRSERDKPIDVLAQVLFEFEERDAVLGHCEWPAKSHICVSKSHIDLRIFTRQGVEAVRVLACLWAGADWATLQHYKSGNLKQVVVVEREEQEDHGLCSSVNCENDWVPKVCAIIIKFLIRVCVFCCQT